jgi:hypothetical protein
MTEQHANEVERVLLHISDARRRAAKAAEELSDGSDESQSIAEALLAAESGLAQLHRTLKQQTYYATPDDTLKLSL